jgi:hypothetical protein
MMIVLDDAFPADLLRAADAAWPADEWAGWVGYDARQPGKRVSTLTATLPEPCCELLRLMAQLRLPGMDGLVPDMGLHGGGLHEIRSGHGLNRHLDAERHPRLGLSRVLSAALYVHPRWEASWGGSLVVREQEVAASPGRFVVFDARGDAWHSVKVVQGPAPRRSMALFWYGPVGGVRTRAEFVP